HFPGKLDLYLALLDEGIASLLDSLRSALESTTDNKQRVRGAVAAYFDFVDDADGAYRSVFESDLINEPAVRERAESTDAECASMLSRVIAEDTGLSAAQAHLLAAGMLGTAQIAARSWLREPGGVSRPEAVDLIASLGWRGIRGFPLSHPPQH
ncbi:MAG: TetR/AcrR family transcriptional regulator, partial [bacterium]